MLVERGGSIRRANRALLRLIGADYAPTHVHDLLGRDAEAFDGYLDRCLGSGEALVGTMHLATRSSVQKTQCKGSAVRGDGPGSILLRLLPSGEPRFAALTQTIAELTEELRKRKRSEAMLEESVRERELLLRELEHRVKNNMQMLSALLSGAERESSSPEAKAALKDASLRFSAVSAVQQLLYRSDDLSAIGSEALVATLTEALSTLATMPLETDVSVDPVDLPIDVAVPVGLILNELLINALKHGRPATGTQSIQVEFAQHNGGIRLCIRDNGPGYDPTETGRRASGIGLVKGLLRQLGGKMDVEQDVGTCTMVTFPLPRCDTGAKSDDR